MLFGNTSMDTEAPLVVYEMVSHVAPLQQI